ncbi:MAG: YegP family protein [Candidatus Bathyarchaeia archaeon]
MPEPKFEIYKDAAGKFRFRLRAANNEIIAVSEAYESKSSCKNGIASVKESAPKGTTVDLSE